MILIVYAGQTTTAEIMRKLMQRFSAVRGVRVNILEAASVTREAIQEADTVVVVRGANFILAKVIAAASKAQKKCVFYIDDDLLSLYPEGSEYRKYLLDTMRRADIIWTSNPNLAEKYSQYGGAGTKTVVADLLEPWEQIAPYQPEENKVGILFAGSPAHEPLLMKYILPAVRRVHEQTRNIDVLLVGYAGTSLDGAEPYIRTTKWFDNADDYREFVIGQRMQIGLGVIEDSAFGRCKYFNKYLEYTKLGVCGVYSGCEPFTLAVRDGENGLLAENTAEGWTQAIARAVGNPALRQSCAAHAREDLRMHYGTDAVIERLAGRIPELESYRAPEGKSVRYSVPWVYYQYAAGRYARQLAHPVRAVRKLWSRRRG